MENFRPSFGEYQEDPYNISLKIKPRNRNRPPLRLSNKYLSLYVAILDEAYEPKPYHCITKKQWINGFMSNNLIDGVEMYSLNAWDHKMCNLSTLTVPQPPHFMKDPSSWQVYHTLKMFLDRSNSAWLFIVGDAAFIREKFFFYFFKQFMEDFTDETVVMARGCCIEPSYCFQILQISSGVFISRAAVKKIINLDSFWNIVFKAEIEGGEALGHALYNVGIPISNSITNGMIGDEFYDPADFFKLETKSFADIPKCEVREELIRPISGQNGNCIREPQLFHSIISWSGGGKLHKESFLQKAELYIKNALPNLGVVWEKTKPRLCIL